MTETTVLAVAFALWIAFGIGICVTMRRAGHSALTWGVIGLTFGPFAVPMAVAARVWAKDVMPVVVATGLERPGRVSLLVGTDGSPESRAAADRAVALLGPALGRCAVAAAVDLDVGQGRDGASIDGAKADVLALSQALGSVRPAGVVIFGRPDEALREYADDHGFDLIAIGCRGAGRSGAVLGSTATRMAKGIGIPVLTYGGASAEERLPARVDDGVAQIAS